MIGRMGNKLRPLEVLHVNFLVALRHIPFRLADILSCDIEKIETE